MLNSVVTVFWFWGPEQACLRHRHTIPFQKSSLATYSLQHTVKARGNKSEKKRIPTLSHSNEKLLSLSGARRPLLWLLRSWHRGGCRCSRWRRGSGVPCCCGSQPLCSALRSRGRTWASWRASASPSSARAGAVWWALLRVEMPPGESKCDEWF